MSTDQKPDDQHKTGDTQPLSKTNDAIDGSIKVALVRVSTAPALHYSDTVDTSITSIIKHSGTMPVLGSGQDFAYEP